jgi:hypothetical protein
MAKNSEPIVCTACVKSMATREADVKPSENQLVSSNFEYTGILTSYRNDFEALASSSPPHLGSVEVDVFSEGQTPSGRKTRLR